MSRPDWFVAVATPVDPNNPSGDYTFTPLASDAKLDEVIAAINGDGGSELTHVPFTATAAGDTTLYTPAAGKRVRLHRIIALNDPYAASSVSIRIKLGATEILRSWALAVRQQRTGATDAALVVNLSAAGNVQGTAFLEEVT